jgi:hypothetical protein
MGSGAFLVEACRQLGDALAQAWHDHDAVPVLPPDEDEVLHAQRQIAQRCLYGVDKNPLAADLAKLSLWLATLAKDHPFTFLDHSLRAGDSLAGLTRRQIAAFHWLPAEQQTFLEHEIGRRIDRISEARRRILAASDDTPYATLQQKLDMAEQELYWLRLAGDAVLAAFFSADKPKPREEARKQLRQQMELALKNPGKFELAEPLENAVAGLRRGAKGVTPFHWEMEFPEVFTVDGKGNITGGFDAIVGNPPFAGKNTMSAGHADGYPDWLKTLNEQSHGNSDLVAHFFRRAFTLLGPNGCFGLIATNTIGQGDTRSTGLRWICTHGGTIYRARKRLKWPGQAAVVVSVVHVAKGAMPGPYYLDNREVPIVTAYLFHAGGHEDPARLRANEGKSFQGSIVLGMGFTFDDIGNEGEATPLAEMHRLIAQDPHNKDRIFPYIGGKEVTNSPTHTHHRYAISFADWPLRRHDVGARWQDANEGQRNEWLRHGIVPSDYPDPVAADFPDLLEIVERNVRPIRLTDNRESYRRYWWNYAEKRIELYSAVKALDRVLAINCGATPHMSFCFLGSNYVFANTLVIIALQSHGAFCLLQSRVHEVWARREASSMKDDLRYTPTDCFETFPFPTNFNANAALEESGRAYYEFRAELMTRHGKGLTTIYNWFHERDPEYPDIMKLRELHDHLDRTVLNAYGWTDIRPECKATREFDDDGEEDGGNEGPSEHYRYRWQDEVRDEVLARLLELNRQRALEEGQLPTEPLVFSPISDPQPKTKGGRNKAGRRLSEDPNLSLLPQEKEEA